MRKTKMGSRLIAGIVLISLLVPGLTACGADSPTATTTPSPGFSVTPGSTTTAKPATTPPGSGAAGTPVVTATPVQSPSQAASTPTASATQKPAPFLPADIPLISPYMTETRQFSTKWKVKLEEVASSRVIAENGELIFVKARSGSLYALNKQNGAVVWKHAAPPQAGIGSPVETFAAVTDATTVVGDLAAETLVGYETATGQLKWTHNLKFDAPNRDSGSRFVGGRVYSNTVVVAVSSKQDPLNPQKQTGNPEYVLVAGVDLTTGKPTWSYITTPNEHNELSRPSNVLFSSKMVIIEEPNFRVAAFEGATGVQRWLAPEMFILRSENLDVLYSGNPGGNKQHNPNIRKHDIETGKIIWEKTLTLQVIDDPLIAIAPDEHFAYLEAKANSTDTVLITVNLESNIVVWNYKTTTFGAYALSASNDGVRLRNYGANSGVVYFDKNQPTPLWIAGGIEFGEETLDKEGLYITGRQLVKNGQYVNALFLLDLANGKIKYADTVTDLPSAGVYVGQTTLYLPMLGADGKIIIQAYNRP